MTAVIVPAMVAAICMWALYKRVDVFSSLIAGARDGLKILYGIFPSLVVLLSGVYMLRASGALELLSALLSPILEKLGMPAQTLPLMLLRPFSGSGALAVGTELISQYGPDSFIGRCAAVMLGSSETTFYVIAVYFGAAGIKKSRRTIPSALAADITGFIISALTVSLLFR